MFKNLRWVVVPLVLVVLIACGSTGGTPTKTAPEQGKPDHQDQPTEPATEPAAAPRPSLVCEDPAPAGLTLGDAVEAQIDDPLWTRCFWVEIPQGLASATFELSGMNADLSLSVGFGFLVTLQYHVGEFWRSDGSGIVDEVLVLDEPTPGPYYIKVGPAGSPEPSAFTLSVRTDPESTNSTIGHALPEPGICAPPAQLVNVGSEIASELPSSDRDVRPREYFCVQVTENMSSLTIRLTELEGDLDLSVRLSAPGEWVDVSRGGSERVVMIENPQPGAYFIDIAGAYPGAGSPFLLNVSSP